MCVPLVNFIPHLFLFIKLTSFHSNFCQIFICPVFFPWRHLSTFLKMPFPNSSSRTRILLKPKITILKLFLFYYPLVKNENERSHKILLNLLTFCIYIYKHHKSQNSQVKSWYFYLLILIKFKLSGLQVREKGEIDEKKTTSKLFIPALGGKN